MNKNEMREIARNLTDKFFETNSRKIATDYKTFETFANTEIGNLEDSDLKNYLFFNFREYIGEQYIDENTIKNNDDEELVKILETKYSNYFNNHNFKNEEHLHNPIYICLHSDLINCYNEKKYISLKYLINNINMECFDSDLFVLSLAIKENNYYILDFLNEYVSNGNKYTGKDGCMFERIFYSMGIEFNSLNDETKNKLIKNFEKIKEILS